MGRRLLVVSSLIAHGRAELQPMYRAAELGSVALARALAWLRYDELAVLRGEEATSATFLSRVDSLTHTQGTTAVDALVHLHGTPTSLVFADGAVGTDELAVELRERAAPDRLRLWYSTACYGATHASALLRGGFRVASGARGTNANSAYDYTVQLAVWALGCSYRSAVRAGNLRLPRRLCDAMARRSGFDDADSFKEVCGDSELRVGSVLPPAGRITHH